MKRLVQEQSANIKCTKLYTSKMCKRYYAQMEHALIHRQYLRFDMHLYLQWHT